MELMQWVVPLDTGELAVGWAPVWAERIPACGRWTRPVRRRGSPLSSRWLPFPLVVGVCETDTSAPETRDRASVVWPVRTGTLRMVFGVALDGEARASPLPPGADDVRCAVLYGELVRVIADIAEGAGVPVTGVAPVGEGAGVEATLGAVGTTMVHQLADALLLLRVAVESCMQARGLQLTGARLRCGDAEVAVDGSLERFLFDAAADISAQTAVSHTRNPSTKT